MSEPERVRLVVRGRVQGVWFRAATREQALALGVAGTVSNRLDGSVEIVAEGSPGALTRLLAWAREGPPLAHVEAVEQEWGKAEGLQGFRVIG